MELSEEKIRENQEKFIELINSITREGDKDKLLTYLLTSDFYFAPATAQYHGSFKGGLCSHSLYVYRILKKLCSLFAPDIPEDSIKLVGLCQSFNKINYYESYVKNVKVYKNNGSKVDDGGRFSWEQVKAYKVKDFTEIPMMGPKGFESYYKLSAYFPLTNDEVAALINYQGPIEESPSNILGILSQNKLATLLYVSDFIASYVLNE